MDTSGNMQALFIIINAGYADELVQLLREAGANGATILNTRSEEMRHESIMGITVEAEKEVIVCVAEKETAKRAMAMIKETMGVNTPAHSVCFTMPIDRAIGFNMSDPEPSAPQ